MKDIDDTDLKLIKNLYYIRASLEASKKKKKRKIKGKNKKRKPIGD